MKWAKATSRPASSPSPDVRVVVDQGEDVVELEVRVLDGHLAVPVDDEVVLHPVAMLPAQPHGQGEGPRLARVPNDKVLQNVKQKFRFNLEGIDRTVKLPSFRAYFFLNQSFCHDLY